MRGFGSSIPMKRQDILVQHGDIEIDVIPDKRTPADEMQKPRQHLPDQRALRNVDLT